MPSILDRLTPVLPLIGQLRGRPRAMVRDDLVAGLTTAIMLIPQAMAYAMLAGLDPIVGLYASTLPLALYALLGTSRQLAVGPVAMVSLLVAGAVGPLAAGDPVAAAAYAALLMLMVGIMQGGMGLVRLGFLVKFMSHPVIAGFTSAAALIIGFSQLKHVLGLPLPRSHHVHEIIGNALQQLGDVHLPTLAIAVVSIVLLVVLKRVAPRFPRFLLVVVGGTLVVRALRLDETGVAVVGAVPSGLPGFSLPPFSMDAVRELLPMALTISLVGFMESISVARAFARRPASEGGGYEVDADKELVALGVANVAGAFFSAYPVTGGFSRTAVNAQAGARSGLAGLVTAGIVAVTLLFFTPLFYFLPKAVLAAIIMTAVFGLIDIAEARHLYKISRPDLAMMAVTFVATLTLGIEQGILVGVAASLLWFVWKTSSPHVAVLGRVPGTRIYRNVERHRDARCPDGVLAVRIDAPLFFANTGFLKRTLKSLEAGMASPLRHLVLDAKAIGSIDAQGDAVLHELVEDYHQRGIEVWFSGVRGPIRDTLQASGLLAELGGDHIVEGVYEAVQRATGAELDPSEEQAVA